MIVTLALFVPSLAIAQDGPELPQASPPAEVMQRVGITDITVSYSSPGKKGRKIWGELVPYGKMWRTGANKATKIAFSRDVTFGGKKVEAGEYSLFTLPTKKGWTVILNRDTELWGTGGHDPAKDAASVTAKTAKAEPVERMAFMFSNTTDKKTRLDLRWGSLRVSVPITIDTDAQVMASIDKAMKGLAAPATRSANYLLDSGGDLKAALGYIKTSIAVGPDWRNHWVQAQILHKMGKKNAARAAVAKALKLGDDSGGFKFYKPRMEQAHKSWK